MEVTRFEEQNIQYVAACMMHDEESSNIIKGHQGLPSRIMNQ
jgi:hypothetical protein